MSTLVTGGTGWIGKHLIAELDGPVHVVSRNANGARRRLGQTVASVIEGDLASNPLSLNSIGKIETVVNLMGESLADGRWNDRKKESIRRSRVDATENLVASLLKCDEVPATMMSASAIGFYGEQKEKVCTESTPPGDDFLATLCVDWEAAASPAVDAGVRVVNIRTGIVLGRGGGAVAKLLTPFRLGLGGRLGSGQQWMSWIHLNDAVAAIRFLIDDSTVNGPCNLVAPTPLQNSEFTRTLAAALRRPAFIPVPATVLQLVLGEFAEYLLASQKVVPSVLLDKGFEYRFPNIEQAWQEIVAND